MPGYLYQNPQVPIQPYQAPLELYMKALAVKDEKFKSGLANIRSKYDSILNLPLTNEQNTQKVRAGVENVMNRLSKVAVSDVSLPENQAEINGLFDPLTQDSNVLFDAAWTRGQQSEISKAEQLQRSKPELVPPQNLEPLYEAQEAFRTGDPNKRPASVRFSPYYDFNSKINTELDKIKADVDIAFSNKSNMVEGPDGKMHNVFMPTQWTVTQLKEYKVNQLLHQRLGTDAQALNQMSLDYNYNKNHGFYSPEDAKEKIGVDISTYKSMLNGYTNALNAGVDIDGGDLSASERERYTKLQTELNSTLAKQQQLKDDIDKDPTKANDYYTFNKYIKDYVESKATQYSYRQEGLVSDMPYYGAMIKSQFDAYGETFKESAKAKAKKDEEQAEIDAVQNPYADLVMKVDSSTGGISATKQEFKALGQMDEDKDGRLFMNWPGNGTNANNTLIFRPAGSNFTAAQQKSVEGNITLSRMKGELEALNLPAFQRNDQSINEQGVPTFTDAGGDVVQRHASSDDLLNQYHSNPDGANPKVKAIIAKYKPAFDSYKIDPTDVSQRGQLKSALSDPTLKKAVSFGETIDLRGRHEFVADPDINLVANDKRNMVMKGGFIVTETEIKNEAGKKGLRNSRDLIKEWGITEIGGKAGDDYKKANERTYFVPVYIPVNGDVNDINDRLLDTQNFQEQWGQKAPKMRQASKEKNILFQKMLDKSQELVGLELPYKQDSQGNYGIDYSLNPTGAKLTDSQAEVRRQMVKIAEDITLRTGLDYKNSIQEVDNIFGTYKTPLQRQIAIDNFTGSGANSLINKFKQAISGNESGGDYSAGAKPGQKYNDLGTTGAGKYAFLEGSFNEVKKYPEFPTIFKNATFEDYKTNPQLQEAAATALASHYYQEFKDPVVMAVAWFTGPDSEETKAFKQDKEAAYLKYRDRKPAGTTGKNMTIGQYVDNFLNGYK